MWNSTTVALNLANTHLRYKPQSCTSPDDGCFPEMTRTAMMQNIYKREPHERVSYLDIKRRILRR